MTDRWFVQVHEDAGLPVAEWTHAVRRGHSAGAILYGPCRFQGVDDDGEEEEKEEEDRSVQSAH